MGEFRLLKGLRKRIYKGSIMGEFRLLKGLRKRIYKGSIMGEFRLLKGSWDLVDYNWSYKSPNWAYPSYNLLITLLTKSHDPLSNPTLTPNNLHL